LISDKISFQIEKNINDRFPDLAPILYDFEDGKNPLIRLVDDFEQKITMGDPDMQGGDS
jgi:hypothetical protein